VDIHGVEQDFSPAVKLLKKSASAAEVPDPNCREMKDAPSCMDILSRPDEAPFYGILPDIVFELGILK
jgi:hypothetical protein